MLSAEEFAYAAGGTEAGLAMRTLEEIFALVDKEDFMDFLKQEIALCMRAGAMEGVTNPEQVIGTLAMGFFCKGWIARQALDADLDRKE